MAGRAGPILVLSKSCLISTDRSGSFLTSVSIALALQRTPRNERVDEKFSWAMWKQPR